MLNGLHWLHVVYKGVYEHSSGTTGIVDILKAKGGDTAWKMKDHNLVYIFTNTLIGETRHHYTKEM